MSDMAPVSMAEMVKSVEEIRRSPTEEGRLALIVRRPRSGAREVVAEAELTVAEGLVGDNWSTRKPADQLEPERQLTIMNARVAGLLAQSQERWQLFGDQLYVDLELSEANLPSGTRLALGGAVIEVTPVDHTGCKRFAERFGVDAVKWVSTREGKEMRLRGMYAKVVQAGRIRAGDGVRKL